MLYQAFRDIARAHATKTALVYDQRRMSYAELHAAVLSLSQGLTAFGAGRPRCIALVLPNCPEFVISLYAAAYLNSVLVPINPLLKKDEISFYVGDCGADAIITDAQHLDICLSIIAELGRDIKLVLIDGNHPAASSFQSLIAQAPTLPEKSAPHDGDILYQFSSGSTGRPKRVNRTQRNLLQEARNFTSTAHVTPDDTILCIVPLFHAHGLGNCLLAASTTGATLVILEQLVRDGVPVEAPFATRCPRVAQLVHDERVTIMPGVPYGFGTLAELPGEAQVDLSSLRLCFSAGNFLPRQVFDSFLERFGIPVRQLYGCTEGGALTLNLDDDVVATHDSVGRPLNNVTIAIVDDAGAVLPPGQVGEIVVRSDSLTSGYVGLPEVNQTAFRDGIFFTGDLGRLDDAGRLYVTGRKKIFIDTGGYKVDPLEVEDVLMTYPGVAEAVVVGIESPYGGEIIKAVVVARGECPEDDLIAYCRTRLADFKVPRVVGFIDAIPKSPLGKILRKNLVQEGFSRPQEQEPAFRQALRAADTRARAYALLERYLREQISQMLKLDLAQLDPQRPLSDFGLNSVTGIELKVRLELSLGLPLSATLVWNYPTIAALAGYLAEMVGAGRARALPAASAPPTERAELNDLEQLDADELRRMLDHETDLALRDLDDLSALDMDTAEQPLDDIIEQWLRET